MARKSKQPPAPVGYYEEDPKDVVFAAMQRKPAGAKWGCFTKEVDDTHVGAFAWFDSQEELIKYVDVWIRCFRTGESPPADWMPPFLVEEDDPNAGAILTEELGARLHEAETMHWAGPCPTSSRARATSGAACASASSTGAWSRTRPRRCRC